MSSLVVVGFPTVSEAEEVRRALVDFQKEQLLSIEDAVVVERNPEGQVHLHQAINLTAAGAASGGFWGVLVGLLFLNPLLGAAVGDSGSAMVRLSAAAVGRIRRLPVPSAGSGGRRGATEDRVKA